MLHFRLGAVLLAGLLCGGCVAVAAGAVAGVGIVKYEENELVRDFDGADFDEVWDACYDSLEELGYPVRSTEKPSPNEGTLETEDVRVRVERHPRDVIRVRVRAGTFATEDNERRAGLVIEKVAGKLD